MRIIKIISSIVLILAFLSVFGALVNSVSRGRSRLGSFTKPFYSFVTFPVKIFKAITSLEIQGIPPTYKDIDVAFEEKNNLNYDVFALNAFHGNNQWEIRLFNLKNDSVCHKWYLNKSDFNSKSAERSFDRSDPKSCILLKNRSIISNITRTNNLYRLDENSNIIWHNKSKLFHHSMNLAEDGNLWVCASESTFARSNQKDQPIEYLDDFITKIDIETGKIIFDKSISELLIENGYKNFIFGFSNNVTHAFGKNKDPLHLNDIEPTTSEGRFWKKEDLFISLRHKSLILQYRPETNELIRILFGPFINQHDIDIVSDHEISIFNNNATSLSLSESENGLNDQNFINDLSTSEIMKYNFEDSTYRSFLKNQFIDESIFTQTEGLHSSLSSGDMYIESQNEGKLYIVNQNEVLLKKYLHTPIEGMIELPHWLRIYENIDF
jgi:hypothetical protein